MTTKKDHKWETAIEDFIICVNRLIQSPFYGTIDIDRQCMYLKYSFISTSKYFLFFLNYL